MRLGRLGLLAVAAGLAATACQASSPATSPEREQPGLAGPKLTPVQLTVPAGAQQGPFAVPRTLDLPKGWTASLWARVPNARMAAWTPEGSLLVSQPDRGRVVQLMPGADGKLASSSVILSGLTSPQGLAFGRFLGRIVLYVAESDQLDRYDWILTKTEPGGAVGKRVVIAGRLPDSRPAGDDVHRAKDLAIGANGAIYFNVGSSSNASPDDRTFIPQRAVIMSVRPDGKALNVMMRGVRNGEGLARAPDGSMWTAVNNRDNISYPFHRRYAGFKDAFGKVIQVYVNDHPPDEVVPVSTGRDLGWPYCNPAVTPTMTELPLIPDALNDPGSDHLNCAKLKPIQTGLPAHSAPLGMTFLEGSNLPAPWSGGAVIAAHGSWNRQPPRAPALLWLRWEPGRHTLAGPVVMVTGFQNPDGTRWGRPVDAIPGPDGALYVTDDDAGAIYRLAPPAAP